MSRMHTSWLVQCILSLVVFLLLRPSGSVDTFNVNGPLIDPCTKPVSVTVGDNFALGFLILPGYSAENMQNVVNTLQTADGLLGLCTPSVKAQFAAEGARVAVFMTRVDRMALLSLPYKDIVIPMVNIPPTKNNTVLLIAFRNNIFSNPVYLASAAPNLTSGVGFVQSVTLMARFSNGDLQYLQWFDVSCDACGGVSSGICVHQPDVKSCATPLENCTCSGKNIPEWRCDYASDQFGQCNTGVNLAWMGTDQKGSAFKTGPQVEKLNAYSIVSLYYSVKQIVMSAYNNTKEAVTSNWNTIKGEAAEQRVDQSSAIGRK